MRTQTTVTDVARNFSEYLDRVAFGGERFTLTRSGRPVAELAPVPRGRRLADLPALLAALPRLGEAQAEKLGEDLEDARETLRHDELRDPWAV